MTDRDRAIAYLAGALTGGTQPAAVGRKFDTDGRPLACPGNTMICHLSRSSDVFHALVDAQDRLKAGPLSDGFTYLPPESFHMTVFEGVIDHARSPDSWPRHLPLDAPISAVTEDLSARLRSIKLALELAVRPTGIFGGFSVTLTGADDAGEALLRETRDRLQEATNIHRPDHAEYGFHITLGYNLRWFTPEEARSIVALSDTVGAELSARVPRIALGPVEFCSFETMHHFETLHLIDRGASRDGRNAS